jgi:hypothetical protein
MSRPSRSVRASPPGADSLDLDGMIQFLIQPFSTSRQVVNDFQVQFALARLETPRGNPLEVGEWSRAQFVSGHSAL